MLAFLIGAATSVISGFLGMKIGVYGNARTSIECQRGLRYGFLTSFRAAMVMGFVLCSMAVLMLFIVIQVYKAYYTGAMNGDREVRGGGVSCATLISCALCVTAGRSGWA